MPFTSRVVTIILAAIMVLLTGVALVGVGNDHFRRNLFYHLDSSHCGAWDEESSLEGHFECRRGGAG